MRICHLCDGSVAGDYFRNVTAGLLRAGHVVLLAELGPGTAPSWLGEFPEVRYHSFGAKGKWSMYAARKALAHLVNTERIDILHTHLFNSGLVAALARKRFERTKFVLMRHHTSSVRMLGSSLHVRADRWMAERADHVVTVSEAAKRYMLDVDGIRRDDIEVIYLGLDTEKFAPDAGRRAAARRELGFVEHDLVIGYVGNFARGKGHLQLVAAFRDIVAELPNARLLLAGGGSRPEVERAVAALPLGSVIFTGWREDIVPVYNAMDIFVQPSLSEAFSQVILEAMGCGLPVVSTDVGGAREVIDDGINGILIAPDDPASITRKVLELVGDTDKRRTIAERGMATVNTNFSAEKMVARHIEMYERWMTG